MPLVPGGILLILKLYFPVLVVQENDLTRRVNPGAVQLVRLEALLDSKVAQAAAAPLKGVLSREVGHEAPEVFNRGEFVIRVEQIHRTLI